MPESVCNQLNTLPLQLVPRAMGQKWSKHRTYWYMVCHVLERHGGGAI